MAGESGGCADVLYSAIRGRASVSGSQCARGSWRGCDTVLVHDRAPWQPHAPVARGRKPTRAVRRLLLSLLDLACTGCCVRVAHSQAVSPGTLLWGIGNFPYRVCSACPTASSTPIALVRAGAGEGNELHAHAHEPADAPPGEGTTPACPHLIDIPVPRHLIESESQRTRVVHDEPSCRYPSTKMCKCNGGLSGGLEMSTGVWARAGM